MKLHLPKSLRGALLACFASLAGLSSTIATGAMLGGAFYVSLSQVAQAEEVAITTVTTNTIWSNEAAEGHAGEEVTVDGGDTAITLQVGEEGGTNQFGSIAEAYQSMDFGSVTVNAGDTLKLWTWTGTNKALGSANKVAIESAITLNQAKLRIEDGSYYFAGAITITGTSSIRTQYAKGISLARIVGDENAVLELVRGIGTNTQKDDSRAVFELTAANEGFSGTVKLVDDNGTPNVGAKDGLQLVLSDTKALVNAVLDFGETEDVTLALNASKVLLKAIKGHGFVEYYNSTSTVGEIELTAASGTFSGTSAANVNWTISGGNQVLSNASILGTYTVGKDASSTFEGAITLGSLVNNSTTGIDVTDMTSLTINNQAAYQGATINLGLLTGLGSGNSFSYGDGWLAIYDRATGTATLSDNSAIYWVDAGGVDDTNNDWASPSNWQGGAEPTSSDTVRLGADAANKTIAFSENASIGLARVAEGDYTFTTDSDVTLTGTVSVASVGASLSKAGQGTLTLTDVMANALNVTEGALVVNSLRVYFGETFTKMGTGGLTLTSVSANALSVSAGSMNVNTLSLISGDTFTKTGAGTLSLSNADGLLGKNITVDAGELHITQAGNAQVPNGTTTTVTVKSGATLDDDRRLGVTGGSFTVAGGGVYELKGICLSAAGQSATTLNVQTDTVLHITGTTQSSAGDAGSFMLSNWSANDVINIHGLLVSESGISDRDGTGTLHVENGGVLQFNGGGLSRSYHQGTGKDTVINVKDGGALVVNGTETDYTDYITTNLAAGATVFTTGGATILNAMHYNGAVELGAAADTILTLTAAAPNVGTITILGSGDTVKTFADDAVTQTSAGGTVKYTNAVSGTAITLNEGAKFEAAAGLNLSGALTLAANSEAKLGGAVTLGALSNAGTIDVSGLTSLTLSQQQVYDGAVISGLGALTGLASGGTFTYGDGWLAVYNATEQSATITANAVWSDGGDDDNIIWADSSNWTSGSTAGYELRETDRVRLGSEAAGKQILVTDHSIVASITVRDAYTFSVAETESWTLTAPITFQENGSITKTGAGSLTLSSSLVTNELTVNEGTLTTGNVTPASGTTFTQSGSGSLVVGTVTANEVSVAGSMSATTANTVEGSTFTKSGAGTLAVGTLNANQATVSAGLLSADTVTLKSGNTFTKAGEASMELGTTNASTLSVSAGDLKMTAWALAAGATANKSGAGTLTIGGDTSALKGNLDVRDGNVTFEADASFGTLAVHEKYVYIGTESKNVDVVFTSSTYNGFSGHMSVAAGSTLTAGSVTANNSTYRLNGAGVYNIGQLTLATSNEGNLEIDGTLTVNVTGTTTDGTTNGSFVLGGSKSTISVNGTLTLASGISATANSTNHVVNVGNGANMGATLWLKDGLWAAVAENVSSVATINVKSGSHLVVDGTNTHNTDKIKVNLADGSTVFTTTGGTILNAMAYTGTVKLGAAAGSTLNLTNAAQTNVTALTILGTTDAVNEVHAGGGVAFTGKVSGASVTLNAGGQLTAAAGLNLSGALTLSSSALATLSGEVSVGRLSNAGSIDVSGISSLAIADMEFTHGSTYNVGALTGYQSVDWHALLGLDSNVNVAYDAQTGYLSFALNMNSLPLWMGGEGATWDSTDANGADTGSWEQGGNPTSITEDSDVVLGNAATLGDASAEVSRTIVLDADARVNTIIVQDAYALSVAEGGRYSFAANSYVCETGGSLSKVGAGTLSMSLADAVAAQMTVTEGTLRISDTISGDATNVSDTSAELTNIVYDADMTVLSGGGTLVVTLSGGKDSDVRSTLKLADAFTGTLEVQGGNLDRLSALGGTTLVRLNNGGLYSREPLAGNHQFAQAIEVQGTSWLRHQGRSDKDTIYYTELTGAISGSGTLQVYEVGDWYFSGNMSQFTGGIDVVEQAKVYIKSDATALTSLKAAGGSLLNVSNNATLTAAATYTTGSSGTASLEAESGSTLNLGAVMIANGTTLALSGAGTMSLTTLSMGNNATLQLAAGAAATITTATEAQTYNNHPDSRTGVRELRGTDFVISVGQGATLQDKGAWELSNGADMTVSGGGVYEVAALALGAYCNTSPLSSSSITVETGTTLHVTGTNTTGSKFGDAFSLGHWDPDNTVTVKGLLALESGLSTYGNSEGYKGIATINVAEGGKIAFNDGFYANVSTNSIYTDNSDYNPTQANLTTPLANNSHVILNVAGGAVLEVSRQKTDGANGVVVNIANEAIVMGGNANGATESTIANDMVIEQGFYVGAAAGTTLTLQPESGQFNFSSSSSWINVLGTADAQGGKVVLDVESLDLNALTVQGGAEAVLSGDISLGGDDGGTTVEAGATLTFDGVGELALDGAIQNAGSVQFLDAANTQFVLSDALLTEDLTGVSKTWTLVEGGSVIGWDTDTLSLSQFTLNGTALSLDEWDGWSLENGKLTLTMLSRFWDADATTEGAEWNTTDENWRPTADSSDTNVFETNSRVIFTDKDEDGNDLQKEVAVADAGVHAKSIVINGSEYSFSRGAVLVDQSIAATQDATFSSSLVIGSSTQELQIDVSEEATLSVGTLETLSEVKNGVSVYLAEGGSFRKTGAGTLRITGDVQGIVNSAVVEGGTLQLAKDASLSVGSNSITGANSITGGVLSNVLLTPHGYVSDGTSGGRQVAAGNVITSADGANAAVLKDVNLQAGSATAYASLQNVSFDGNSSLSGFITFEKTKHQREISVADDGTLAVNGLTFDLHGLSIGEKVLIENGAVADAAAGKTGTITGWENISLKYSGVDVNMDSVDISTAGVVTIKKVYCGVLYWDGLGADGAADANWNASSTNWNTEAGDDGSSVYQALSDTYFAATPADAAKNINVAQDMVATNLYIKQGGYSFSGYRVATLADVVMNTPDAGAITFNNELVVQGSLTSHVAGELTFAGETSVVGDALVEAGSLNVSNSLTVKGDLTVNSGSTAQGGAGSMTLGTGASISAQNITLTVNAGASSDAGYADAKVDASGNISADGTLTLNGNAAKNLTGSVTAHDIVVGTGVITNAVSFAQVAAETLTVGANSTVDLTADGAAGIKQINLAGALGYDKFAGNFWNYDVVSTSETASVTIASIAKVSMSSLSGADLGNGTYGSVVFNGGFRRLTIDNLYHVQNITFGSSEEGVRLTNATGQIYGDLTLEPGSSLTVSCNDIMANGQGAWSIEGTVNLGHTTQTLAGNAIRASAAVIRGDMYHQETQRDEVENVDVTVNVLNTGLNITENTDFSFTGNNTLSANMNVAAGKTLTLHAGRSNEDTITISGHLGGFGSVVLDGSSGMGTVSLAADNGYNGTMSVKNGMTLQLEHTGALSEATLHLDAGATLLVDTAVLGAPAEIASLNLVGTELVTLDGQQYNAGLIQVNNLAATESFSAADSAFMVGELQLAEAITLNLQLAFSEGGLQNMMTYNLFAADAGHPLQSLAEQLHLDLYVVGNGITNHVASNQYEVVYDAKQNVISLRTMLGHIWSGGGDTDGDDLAGEGIWSTSNPQAGNWSGKDYDESSGYTNAIFVDLEGHDGKQATVTIQGTVTPGDIYFEADKTYYNLTATNGDGILADGTNIHKAGSAMVYLSLANNGTMEHHAVGNVDLQAGTITLSKDLAVRGEVIVAQEAHLRGFATAGGKLITAGYTATGDFSGVTLGQDTISGLGDAKGLIASTDIYTQVAIVGEANAPVLLENVTLASYGSQDKLTNVAIGEKVDVTGCYTLSGRVHFRDTLTLANTGTVNLDSAMTAEIGKLAYTFTVNESTGASEYIYQLVKGGQINGMSDLTVQDVFINGVNLSTGLADGVATVFTGSDGSLRLSIGNKTSGADEPLAVDGSVGMPKWDERWNNDKQPGLSRRYAGTVSSAVVTFKEGIDGDADHYYYSSVVNDKNANAVNGEQQEIVVTLSAAATGAIAAGGASDGDRSMEMWVYDRSGFDTVIAGRYSEELTSAYRQGGDTHLLINTDTTRHTNPKTWVVGGSWLAGQDGASYVTVQAGNILNVVGATYGANQEGASTVYIDGGRIYELFAGGYDASLNADDYGDVASVNLIITGGTLGLRTDTVRKRVYGGSYHGTVEGDVNVTVDGPATITDLVGGGYDGSVAKDITLDLISGTITRVDAAGVGGSSVGGNVLVNLHKGFGLTEVYGGKQNSVDATVEGNSTLFFADAGETYDMTSTTIQGFSHLSLADDTYVKLTTDGNHFGTDNASRLLTISGTGKVELIGSTDLARDITLVDGATLWINSNHVGNKHDTTTSRYTITATAGTTLEVTGRPDPEDDEGLTFWLGLAGHGVNDMGALYKAATGISDPSGKVAFPRVTFSDSASINTEASIYWIESSNAPSDVYLNGNTLTKIGDQSLVIYNADVVDNSADDADTAVDGTFFVKEGSLGIGYGMRAAKTNVVLSQGTTLDIVAQGNNEATIGALSGSGSVVLDNTFTIHTSAAGSYGARSEWMTQGADKYGQFDSDAGFAYGVFSGSISGAQALSLSGDGTQYLSGNESSYSGGTHLYDSATLYLMGSTEGSASMGSSSATAGAVGTDTISWDSANAKLYLGNGVQVFNNGTTNVAGSNMIIGVEAAPKGDALTNYMGTHDSVIMNGTKYVEVDTHNLSSISCNGKYADGTIYQAGELIDRDKMLLVEKSTWDAGEATVSGFSAGGYNTATYSGVLSGNANLMKVGAGTLILDQSNTYTGSTIIDAGSLVLKGWAKIGGSSTTAALNVEQKAGSSLMLAYDGTYGDEITQITNDISINGTGDVRWTTEAATGNDTAALISTIGSGVSFALRGDISEDGNVLHAGAGTLVLSGDSTYTGGTHATTGVVEVQSAAGLGSGKVEIDATADLHATVEAGTTASRLTTAIKAAGSSIKGDVVINGTADTERVLSMNTNGYYSSSTTLNDTGTLLVNGAGVQTNTALLKGTGTLAVSDVSGQGATAQADALMDFTGDFVVEGNNAKIEAKQGNFNGGSMSISGQNAKVTLAGTATIAYGETLSFTSNGHAESANVSKAAALEAETVTVDSGALLTVSNAATDACYNLANLAKEASVAIEDVLTTKGAGQNVHNGGGDAYTYHFDAERAMNDQRAGAVLTGQGLTLNGGSRYETHMANVSLVGGALTLNTDGGKIALNLLTDGNVQNYSDDYTSQIVLFSDVSSVNLGDTPWGEANAITLMAALDGEAAEESNTIYSTLASNYFTGWNITDETYLVYDVGARVVYLDKAVPEPTTTTLSMLALAGLLLRRRRKM